MAASLAEKIRMAVSMADICLQISEEFSKSGEYFALTYLKSSQALRLVSRSPHPILDSIALAEEVPLGVLGGKLSKTIFEGETQIVSLKEALKELNSLSRSGYVQIPGIESSNVIIAALKKGSEILGAIIVGGTGLDYGAKAPVDHMARIASMRIELLGQVDTSRTPKEVPHEKARFLRMLMDTVPGAVFYKNKNLCFEDCNSEFEIVTGLPRERIIGKTIEEVLPEKADFIKQKDEELLQKGGIQTYELNLEINATPRDFLVRKSVVLDSEGKLLGVVGVMVDISDLKKAEQAVTAYSDLMRAIIDSIPDPVFVLDKDKKVIAWNRAIEELTGIPKASIIGKGGYEYAIPFYGERRPLLLDLLFESDERCARSYTKFEKFKERAIAEGYVNSKFGKIYVIAHASLIYDSSGNLLGGIETFKDITRHKEAENALRQSEERYRAIVEDLTEAVVRFKPDGEITFVNDAFTKMIGVGKESLVGRNVFDLMSEEERKEVSILLANSNKEPFAQITSRAVKPDGSAVWIMWSGRAIHDSSGRIVEFQAAGRDITELKRLEEKLESLVEERTRKLQEAERLATIGQIAASVGHDLRAPLQSIINSAHLIGVLASDPKIPPESSSEIQDLQKKIERQVTYMNGIISDIRDFARNLVIEPRPVRISHLLDEALSLVNIPDKINLSIDIAVRDPVVVDPNMITRVLVNLVTNAVQAMPEGGLLQINARDCGKWFSLEVKDTGIGIPEEHLKKLFTPLFTTKSKGSGLGLAICKRIVETHNGRIMVESQVGKGTTFIVELPKTYSDPQTVLSAQQD